MGFISGGGDGGVVDFSVPEIDVLRLILEDMLDANYNSLGLT